MNPEGELTGNLQHDEIQPPEESSRPTTSYVPQKLLEARTGKPTCKYKEPQPNHSLFLYWQENIAKYAEDMNL